ncbi:MAG: enoyl-ACP reductase FabI [Rhodospirillales bacterium]
MSQNQPMMTGKKGLVMGIANDRSIAWGIADALSRHGATLAFTYQNEAIEKRVRPLAESVGADHVLPCDVANRGDLEAVFQALAMSWDSLDFVVHAVAYSDKNELKGRYVDTTPNNFKQTMDISCFSFTATSQLAAPLMKNGGSLLTLSYTGSRRVMPNYNVMGVAKAALEASVKYLAADLGPQAVRVNALSAGPMRTLAGSAIADARAVYRWNAEHSPLRRNVSLEEVGHAALYLLSDLSSGVTGEIHHVDSGYNIIGVSGPKPHRENGDEP